MADEIPGSTAALVRLVDRIARLSRHDEVSAVLPTMDVEQLQHRATEAAQTLSLCIEHESMAAHRPTEATIPCLCGLAVECINVVERAELRTSIARLVTAGCEVLSALLLPWAEGSGEAWSFDWVQETLEDLSDQIDFLALEVYCGLGRLETKVSEWDELPAVLDPGEDSFDTFWGSIEHRQALQELSAWLLCILFRALGYASVSGRALMEFANRDTLCLCSLLRGLFAGRLGDSSLPHDLGELQAAALAALCGLTAPELAFYYSDGAEGDIHEQNRALNFYMEVLASAMVETGVLEASLAAVLVLSGRSPAEGAAVGAKFLQFLASLLVEVALQGPRTSAAAPLDPLQKLRKNVFRAADKLGSLLEVVTMQTAEISGHRDLVASCACLAAALVQESGQPEGCSEDHFTLTCRFLVASGFDTGSLSRMEASEKPGTLAALGALACNVGELDFVRPALSEQIGLLAPEDVSRARQRLVRQDRHRLVLTPAGDELLALFGEAPAPPMPPAPTKADKPTPTAPGLRDIVQNAPKELRCALDSKLLCDPVTTPGGIVFERSTLARWLQTHGATCPITGVALCLEECQRCPELRRQVTEWVRSDARRTVGRRKK